MLGACPAVREEGKRCPPLLSQPPPTHEGDVTEGGDGIEGLHGGQVTMEAVQELGCDESTSQFVLPLAATINMTGTALYEATTVIFIAQVGALPLFRVLPGAWPETCNP